MRQLVPLFLVGVICLFVGLLVLGRQIHIPSEVEVFGHVIIAETGAFYEETKDGELIPREFQAWPGEHGLRSADWFDVRIEADYDDVIVLAAGVHKADVWIFAPGVTVTTDPASESLGQFWGTVEIDADNVTLDRIGVIGPRKGSSSGHGIELNRGPISRVTIRDCVMKDNEWTGIHIIGAHGTIQELCVEDCTLEHNGMDGMDDQSTINLIVTGCTITDNGWNFDHGVGVRIGMNVEHIEMHDNVISGNRYADVTGMD